MNFSNKFNLFWTRAISDTKLQFSHNVSSKLEQRSYKMSYLQTDNRCLNSGSVKAKGREPKTGLDRVFNIKLGCFDDVCVLIYADARPHLYLKTRPRFSPVSFSLSMLNCIKLT
jgi:hypothetical protein